MGILSRARTLQEIAAHPLNRGRPFRSLLRYLAWNLGRRMIDADFVMPLASGARLLLSNHENYATLAYSGQLWDFPEMLFMMHLLRPSDLFLDVGANVGGYTVLATVVTGASAVAVEPVPATFAKLGRNIRLNDVASRVEALNIGLAEDKGVLRFTDQRGGLNHVVASGGIEVPVETLDATLAGRIPTMMKIDVEGFEVPVLRSGADTLSDPGFLAVVIEMNGSGERYGYKDQQSHELLTGHGFRPCTYDPFARRLLPVTWPLAAGERGLNVIYSRDSEGLGTRLRDAPKVRVRDLEI